MSEGKVVTAKELKALKLIEFSQNPTEHWVCF
jgi:hypothetical protein